MGTGCVGVLQGRVGETFVGWSHALWIMVDPLWSHYLSLSCLRKVRSAALGGKNDGDAP